LRVEVGEATAVELVVGRHRCGWEVGCGCLLLSLIKGKEVVEGNVVGRGSCSLLCGKTTQYCVVMQCRALRRLYRIVSLTRRNNATAQPQRSATWPLRRRPAPYQYSLGVEVRSQGHWCRSDALQLCMEADRPLLRSVSAVTWNRWISETLTDIRRQASIMAQ
jgi:hypothetical protein